MANLSNINNKFLVTTGGNVGIGSTSPTSPLVVVGTGVGSSGTIGIQGANAHVGFKNSSGTFRSWVGHFNAATHGSDADLNLKTGYGTTGNIRFSADGDTTAAQMFLQGSSGNVGIGTTGPSAKLDIGGNTVGSVQAIFGRGNSDSAFSVRYTNGITGTNNTVQGTIGLDYANGYWADMAAVKFIRDSTAGELAFYTSASSTSGVERMRITSAGNLKVGGTNAGYAGTLIHTGNYSATQ